MQKRRMQIIFFILCTDLNYKRKNIKKMKEKKVRKIRELWRNAKVGCIVVFCLSAVGVNAQVTIGSGTPAESGALLDLKQSDAGSNNETSKKGMIYPRVALDDNYKDDLYPMFDVASAEYIDKKDELKKSHTGLVVYNVTQGTIFSPGLYCWNGETWRKMDDSPAIKPGIGENQLLCANATLSPATYTAGVELKDYYLKVPYLGGTGGNYEGAPPVAGTNGLSIERIGGKLAFGSGEVVYRVTGTPTHSSPTTTTFPIEFLGETGDVTVGDVSSVNLKNLMSNVEVKTNFTTNSSGSAATELPFGDIIIEETGSYAFSLRLYGKIPYSGNNPMRLAYYIFLQKNDKNTLMDAAELDLIVTTDTDYSYSVTLGGLFEAGDKVIISMHRSNYVPTNWTAPAWTLKMGSSPTSPVRTSLIYWKL